MGTDPEKVDNSSRLGQPTGLIERNGVPEDLTAEERAAAGVVLSNFFEHNRNLIASEDIASLLQEASMLAAELQQSIEGIDE